MTSEQIFYYEVKQSKDLTIVSTWVDADNQKWVVYKLRNTYFITGDELEWEFDWYWSGSMMLEQQFKLTATAYIALKEVIVRDKMAIHA